MDKELELSWKAGPSFDPYEKDINKVAEHLQKVYGTARPSDDERVGNRICPRD